MRRLLLALFVALLASPVSAASLQLTIQNGQVSLDAQDVTIRQILTEWARVGRTRFVNLERIAGGPVTLKFTSIPEKQALDIVLRSVPGYMAVPRDTIIADASVYDRVLLMPTTTAVAAVRPQPPAPAFGGLPGGANLTQLRPVPPPLSPGVLPEQAAAADQVDDPAIAAAAAAGLITVPAPASGLIPAAGPLVRPGVGQVPPPGTTPSTATPANPFNVTTGSSQPSLAPPQPPPGAQPPPRARPPQGDQ